jgi:hypothetical protein
MTSHLHLAEIDPTKLSTLVTSSGLVTTDQLCEAYKTQALRYQKGFRTSYYDRWRAPPVWKASGTTIVSREGSENTPDGPIIVTASGTETMVCGNNCTFDSLQCPLMESGVHKWSIKILEGTGHGFGVISTQDRGCSLYEDYALREERNGPGPDFRPIEGLSFKVDTIVSFTLDLGGFHGILTASINGQTPVEIFSDLHIDLEGFDGFVPSVYVVTEGRVEFLGFEYAS